MIDMQTKTFDNTSIVNTFKDILNSLSQKERNVIEKRI